MRCSKQNTFEANKNTMKQFLLLIVLLSGLTGFAQAPTRTISGNITSNYTFHNDTIYVLDGFVYVKNNAVLTVEPGTIVKGIKATRSTLIITMGSKIIANGTKARPIVFTSNEAVGNRAPGDWGGIIILGRNIINRDADCSTCPGASVAASLDGGKGTALSAALAGLMTVGWTELDGAAAVAAGIAGAAGSAAAAGASGNAAVLTGAATTAAVGVAAATAVPVAGTLSTTPGRTLSGSMMPLTCWSSVNVTLCLRAMA